MIYLEFHARILTDPRLWDVKFASTHTSRELNASFEVLSVFLGHVWYPNSCCPAPQPERRFW